MINFSLQRVRAVTLRYLLLLPRDVSRWFDMFYWPIMDLMLWGFTGAWMQQHYDYDAQVGAVFILAPILWQFVSRFALEIPRNLLEEMWGGSMVNLFASPVTLLEWFSGIFVVALIGMGITMISMGAVAQLLYKFDIFMLGWLLVPFMISLIFFGLILALFCSGLVVYKGSRIASIIWAMPWILAPIGGVFYPLNVLPYCLQVIACCFPPSYIFESMREVILHGTVAWDKIMMSFALNMFYLPLAIIFFRWMFKRSCSRGLSLLTRE